MKKISVKSSEFQDTLLNILDKEKKLVIWHQIPWSGGLQEWFLIRHVEELDKVLARGRVASAFTAYEWLELSLPPIADQTWLAQIQIALSQETDNAMLLLAPKSSPFELSWIGDNEDLNDWFEKHRGTEVFVGRLPNLWTGEIIRGYFPDNQGVPQSGAY